MHALTSHWDTLTVCMYMFSGQPFTLHPTPVNSNYAVHDMVAFRGTRLNAKKGEEDIVGAIDPTIIQIDTRLAKNVTDTWKYGDARFFMKGINIKDLVKHINDTRKFGPDIWMTVEEFNTNRDKGFSKEKPYNPNLLLAWELNLKGQGICFWCRKKGAERKCSKCQIAVYCDRKCQREDWPIHKLCCLTRPSGKTKADFRTTADNQPQLNLYSGV